MVACSKTLPSDSLWRPDLLQAMSGNMSEARLESAQIRDEQDYDDALRSAYKKSKEYKEKLAKC